MKLAWIRYGSGETKKHMLMLRLGQPTGKFVGLISEKVPNEVIKAIRVYSEDLDKMDTKAKVSWIKEIWPGYSSAYREIKSSNMVIEKTIDLEPISV